MYQMSIYQVIGLHTNEVATKKIEDMKGVYVALTDLAAECSSFVSHASNLHLTSFRITD